MRVISGNPSAGRIGHRLSDRPSAANRFSPTPIHPKRSLRMRIAMFSSESLHSINTGGLGVHVTELAAGLQRRGHDVHVITRRMHEQKYYDRIDGVRYHRVVYGST